MTPESIQEKIFEVSHESNKWEPIPSETRARLRTWVETELLRRNEVADNFVDNVFSYRYGEVCADIHFGDQISFDNLSSLPEHVHFLGSLNLAGVLFTTLPTMKVEQTLDISATSIELTGEEPVEVGTLVVSIHQQKVAQKLVDQGKVRELIVNHNHKEWGEQ
jgi:hypothetical protein